MKLAQPPQGAQSGVITNLGRDRLAWGLLCLTLGFCVAIVFDFTPLLRGPAPYPPEWRWAYVWPPNLIPWNLIWPLGVLALAGGWYWATRKALQLNALQLLTLIGLALAFRLSIESVRNEGLSIVARMLNPTYFGYFTPAAAIEDLPNFLRTFTRDQLSLPYDRVQTHPPGNVVFYWLIIHGVDSLPFISKLAAPLIEPRLAALPDWINNYSMAEIIAGSLAAFIVPLLSALSLWPLYQLGKILWDEQTARLACWLYIFIPALTVFTPVTDDLFTLWAALSLWLVVSGLVQEQLWRIALAGFIWGLGLFMSFGLLALGLSGWLLIVLYRQRQLKIALQECLVLGVAGSLIWIMAWATFNLNPFLIYQNSLAAHGAVTSSRSYWLWLFYNPYDVLIFAGLPIAIFALGAVFRLGQQLLNQEPLSLADQTLAACLLAMLLVFLSGSVRGETARILLFVYPWLALFAAGQISRTSRPAGFRVLMIALVVIQTLVFQISLNAYI